VENDVPEQQTLPGLGVELPKSRTVVDAARSILSIVSRGRMVLVGDEGAEPLAPDLD
jgi:hypothetical protein